VTTRKAQWQKASLGLIACALGGVVCAAQPPADLDQRYPPGSITTEALAEQALADVQASRQALDARYKAESTRCARVILTTECQDKARRAHMLGQTQAHRVELEAHDLQRKLAAQRRASERDTQQEQLHQQEAERPEKERQAHDAAQQRVDRAKEHEQDALRQQAQAPANRERYLQRNAQHEQDEAKRVSVQLRNVAENERRYQDKQTRAKDYAASRAREREENRKAREEKERKRNAEAAAQSKDAAPAPK
jgi:colicin import membrane protein